MNGRKSAPPNKYDVSFLLNHSPSSPPSPSSPSSPSSPRSHHNPPPPPPLYSHVSPSAYVYPPPIAYGYPQQSAYGYPAPTAYGHPLSGSPPQALHRSQYRHPLSQPPAYRSSADNAPEGEHGCHLCNKVFTERGNLNKHFNSVHVQLRPHECLVPGCNTFDIIAGFADSPFFVLHTARSPKSFSFRDGLIRHETTVHDNERPYECELCTKTFKQHSHLQKHMRSAIHQSSPARGKARHT